MSQTPITVTYPLEEVFGEIKQGALKNPLRSPKTAVRCVWLHRQSNAQV